MDVSPGCFKVFKSHESDDDEMYGMRQAFPVPFLPSDFDPTIPPTSGEEYLQHVVYEARNFAPIFTAKGIRPSALKSVCDPALVPTKPSLCVSSLAPTREWEQEHVNKFTKLRNKVHSLRMSGKVFSKSHVPDPLANAATWSSFLSATEPLLTVVLSFRQEQLEALLVFLQNLIEAEPTRVPHGCWLYAVCVCLEHPLSREACGELRDIARKCSVIRQSKEDPKDSDVITANLFITLVVRYFGQRDLCDET